MEIQKIALFTVSLDSENYDFDFTEKSQYFIEKHERNQSSLILITVHYLVFSADGAIWFSLTL